MDSRSCSGSGRELLFLKLQTGLKYVSILNRKAVYICMCKKNCTFQIKDDSEEGIETEKLNAPNVGSQCLQVTQTQFIQLNTML